MIKISLSSRLLRIICLSLILTAVVSFGIIKIIASTTPEPGSNQDPIVTKSYVDMKIAEALSAVTAGTQSTATTSTGTTVDTAALETKIAELETKLRRVESELNFNTLMVSGELVKTKFMVVQLSKGQKLLLGEGTEMILRAGIANSISGPGGDMSNLTNGLAVPNGAKLDLNHLIISSREDGRGLIVISDTVWVLVKGSYKVAN